MDPAAPFRLGGVGWAPENIYQSLSLLAISGQKAPILIFHTVFATDYLIAVTFVVIGGNKNTKTHNLYYTQRIN